MKLRLVVYALSVTALCSFVFSCASSKPPLVDLKPPTFAKFVSADSGKVQPSDISIGIMAPRYGASSIIYTYSEWSGAFANSLSQAIEQLILSKGYKVVGPFKDVNEMTFPQKKQCDLILCPVIEVSSFTTPQPTTVSTFDAGAMLLGGNSQPEHQEWSGPCAATAFVSFEAYEPLSMQKMWMKRVDIQPADCDCSAKYVDNFQVVEQNAYGRLLEAIYNESLKKSDAYFSREEIDIVVKQSKELRDKKVY